MKPRRSQLLFLIAFTGCLLASFIPISNSFEELDALRISVQRARDASAASRDARLAADEFTSLIGSLLPVPHLPRDAARAEIVARAKSDLGRLMAAVSRLEASVGPEGELRQSLAGISDDWRRIDLDSGSDTGLAQPDAILERLRDQGSQTVSKLRALEQSFTRASATDLQSLFDHLGAAARLILAAVVVGCSISAYSTVSAYRSLLTAAHSRGALQKAEDSLRERSDQLTEAQRLGKLGEWRYLREDGRFEFGPEALSLLKLPEHAILTREVIEEMLTQDCAQQVRETQEDVLATGRSQTIDIKVRRGDGTLGDFALASKALSDASGRIIGLFGTIQDITERKAAESQLESLAYYDPLTGLANRALFNRELLHALARQEKSGTGCALMLLDLDHFKQVNESLGHGAGDELLIKVGVMLWRMLGRRAVIARLGGDEFAVILTEKCDEASLASLAETLTRTLSATLTLERGEADVSASIGIVIAPRDGHTASDLLRNADIALYKAKEQGRNRFVFFSQDLETATQTKTMNGRDLRNALSTRTGLHVHYQPQFDLATGRVVGFEALARWNHPERGAIPPSEFIPVAESSSLIADLGNWVLGEAVRQGKAWLDAGVAPREISVNVSAAQIWHGDFVGDVADILHATGLPPHLLCLELTESLMVDYSEGRVRAVFKALKGLGVTLALDDFGTDYSSLGYLAQLPFDKLKIDRIFIHGCAASRRAREILKGIIALGRGLGMTVVAEGAESREEIEVLREAQCDLVQGFVFSSAMPPAEAQHLADACDRHGGLQFLPGHVPSGREHHAAVS